ncbi:hypothetical protein CEXT_58731 [Caerostris extrusa]|uniref:Ribosomal protein S10 n=1 Tax=Caerostris extrusa TaxID=172846 RepID=A0AAV4XM60_CAEEX|nr:hypothetical protein CEXT_58731 [Caerostris extrusa]
MPRRQPQRFLCNSGSVITSSIVKVTKLYYVIYEDPCIHQTLSKKKNNLKQRKTTYKQPFTMQKDFHWFQTLPTTTNIRIPEEIDPLLRGCRLLVIFKMR